MPTREAALRARDAFLAKYSTQEARSAYFRAISQRRSYLIKLGLRLEKMLQSEGLLPPEVAQKS